MSKRRRICNDSRALRLADLPNEALAHAAQYLAGPSRAIFALAIPGEDRQRAILSSTTVLDFGLVEKSLAARLADRHIQLILSRIDNLKRLAMGGCVNVTGRFLDPLRGSTQLEMIDLSLVGQHERPAISPKPMLCEAIVLPFLDSIIAANGSSLKLLVLPKKWRTNQSDGMCQFLQRYDDYLKRRECICSRCGSWGFGEEEDSDSEDSYSVGLVGERRFGMQNNLCYKCTQLFCTGCAYEGNEDNEFAPTLHFCAKCEREHCSGCLPGGERCPSCGMFFCEQCEGLDECAKCGTRKCADCLPSCRYCDAKCCFGCFARCQPLPSHVQRLKKAQRRTCRRIFVRILGQFRWAVPTAPGVGQGVPLHRRGNKYLS